MNYRHGFHAGNFADLAKHAALLVLLRLLREREAPLLVVDTHAGAGFYDLSNPDFARSKEAAAGIQHLMGRDVPISLKPLADYVRARNLREGFRDRVGIYPGSPLLVLDHIRATDAYVGCELREDDFALLRDRVEPRGKAVREDGYATAVDAAGSPKALLYLIDPPFERGDDYDNLVATLHAILSRRPEASVLIWLPLKDLETFDAWLRSLERALDDEAGDGETGAQTDIHIAELRLRPLWNPMKMNGCALVCVNPPEGFNAQLKAIARDVVAVFGEPGGEARCWVM